MKFVFLSCGLVAGASLLHSQTVFTSDADGNRTAQAAVVAATAPILVSSPADQLGQLTGTARFSVLPGGTGPFTYQWFKAGSPIAGATADTLVLTGLVAGDFTPAPGGTPRYTVQVTNAHSSVTSAPAALYRDSSGRGLADWWQQQYFGNLNVDPNADADGDGVTNGQEFADGTDPTAAGSRRGRLLLRGPAALVSAFPSTGTYANGASVSARGLSFGELQFGGFTGSLRSASSNFTFNFASGGDHLLTGLFGAMPVESSAPPAVFGNASTAPVSIFNFATAPDGSVIVCGLFDRLNDLNRRFVARLLPGGAADPTFAPVADATIFSAAVQPDGKVILIGSFTQLNGQARPGVARVLANGTLDASFAPASQGSNISQISTVAIQRDGKILLGGAVWTGSGFAPLVRLNADGSRDLSFAPALNGLPSAIALQPDARIVLGGGFTDLGGTAVPKLIRLLPNGTLDPAFSASTTDGVTTQPTSVIVQPDGRILAGGSVQIRLNGSPVTLPVIRLNANGTLDTAFTQRITTITPMPTFSALALQDDGRIVGVGSFALTKPDVVNALRLETDGSVDPDGFVISRPSGAVTAAAPLSDGSLIFGGGFVSLTPREGPMNNHRYVLSAGRKTWNAAEAEAQALGGHLATVAGPSAQSFVTTLLLPAFGLAEFPIWIGYNDRGVENLYAWSNGAPVTYINWNPGEPNGGTGENVAALNWLYAYNRTNPGAWIDVPEVGVNAPGNNVNGAYYGLIEVDPAAPVATPDNWVAGRDLARNERAGSTVELSNPNATVPAWSYGVRDTQTSVANELSLFVPGEHVNNPDRREGWVRPPYTSVLVNAGETGNAAPTGVVRPGEVILHPPPTGFTVVRWTAPTAGTYAVSALWQDVDWNAGDGCNASLVRTGTQVVFSQDFDNGGGASCTHVLTLAAGETLDFLLGTRANDGADSTRFDALIKRVPNASAVWAAGRDLTANEKPDGGAQETMNPNPTVPAWSYGYRNTVVSSGLTIFPTSAHLNSLNGGGPDDGMEGWGSAAAGVVTNTGTTPLSYNYGFGPNLPFYPNEMLISPGGSGGPYPVVRWTAPAAGTYDIFAFWQDDDFHGGNGFSAHLVVNGGQVYGQDNDNAHGCSTVQTLTLAAGDEVDFTMGTRGAYEFDTTKFNATIIGPGAAARPPAIRPNAIAQVASRTALAGNTTIDWASAGANNASFGNPFGVTASNGATFRISKGSDGNFQRLTQGNGWFGNFAPGDAVLNHVNSDGPVRLTAAERAGVFSAVGMQIMPNQDGAFTATMHAYDVNGALLGSVTVNGTGNATADNSAVFLGLRSESENIHSVSIDTNTTGFGGDFAINHVHLVMTPAANGDLAFARHGFARLVTTNLLAPGTLGVTPAGPNFATGAAVNVQLAPQTFDAAILHVRLESSSDGRNFQDFGALAAGGSGIWSANPVLPPGQTFYRAVVTDHRQQQRRSFAVGPFFTPPAVTSALTANGSVALPFSYAAAATGPLTGFTASGLPAWASAAYDANTGLLTISGTPSAPGVFNVSLQPANTAGATLATLTIVVANRFAAWQNANFTPTELADPNLSGPLGDVTGYGVANLLRYALGIPARQRGTAGLPVVAIQTHSGTKYLTMTYRRDRLATDVTATVQVSANLQSWASDASALTEVSRTDQGDGTDLVVVRDNVPATSTTHRFMRLQVSP